MDRKKIISDIKRDDSIKSGEKLIVCLNKEYDSMLHDAFLLRADGTLQEVTWETTMYGDLLADEAAILLDEDELLHFRETRTKSYNYPPNGILVCDQEFPCVVFCNTGGERLTVGMEDLNNRSEWVAPGGHIAYY